MRPGREAEIMVVQGTNTGRDHQLCVASSSVSCHAPSALYSSEQIWKPSKGWKIQLDCTSRRICFAPFSSGVWLRKGLKSSWVLHWLFLSFFTSIFWIIHLFSTYFWRWTVLSIDPPFVVHNDNSNYESSESTMNRFIIIRPCLTQFFA